MKPLLETLKKVWDFYIDGFRNMTTGKTLWIIILVKLFIILVVLRLLFRPAMAGMTDSEKQQCVATQIISQ